MNEKPRDHHLPTALRNRRWLLFAAVLIALAGLVAGHTATAAPADEGRGGIEPVGPLAPSGHISGTIIIPLNPCFWYGGPPIPPPPGLPTPTPRPSPTPGPATALSYGICPQITNRIPTSIQQEAVASPWRFYGYGKRQNPSVPHHPLWNPYRKWLTLLDYGKPWSICNPVVWKAGCP